MLKAILVIALVALVAAVGFSEYNTHHGGATADRDTARQLAQSLCAQNTLQQVIDAYPQAHMSKEALGRQTLGQGLKRLAEFHDKLPAIVQPAFASLQDDPTAWNGVRALAAQVSVQVRRRNWDPGVKKRFTAFLQQTIEDMRTTCPSTFQKPIYNKYADFAVGAVIGAAGSQ